MKKCLIAATLFAAFVMFLAPAYSAPLPASGNPSKIVYKAPGTKLVVSKAALKPVDVSTLKNAALKQVVEKLQKKYGYNVCVGFYDDFWENVALTNHTIWAIAYDCGTGSMYFAVPIN